MSEDEATPDIGGIIAIALGVVAWVSFLLAFFMADDPIWFLLFALVCGGVALAVGLKARREETAAVAAGGAAAGAALLWGVSVVAALTAMVYAVGVMLVLAMFFFMAAMFGAASASSSSGGGCGGSGGGGGGGGCCCCEDCCDDCGDACCDCGCSACDCGCGDCGCGGCGGCGCIGFGMVLAPAAARATRPARWRTRFAHHPDAPEYHADVYVVAGGRFCIGCFTTYPVFLVASALFAFVALPSTPALAAGAVLALVQLVSSAGLARTRALKAAVKTCLGLGLALVVAGVHSAAWPPQWKVAALLGVLALAWLSAVPRARRMRKARPACVHRHEGDASVVAPPPTP